jgi:ABC-type sugar transport system permease subunit
MATIWNFQVFDSIIVLTDGAPNYATASVAWYIYKQTFTFSNVGIGAAMSVLMLVAILLLTIVQLRLLRRRW